MRRQCPQSAHPVFFPQGGKNDKLGGLVVKFCFDFFLTFHLFISLSERKSAHKPGKWQTEGEADSSLSKEAGMGLDSKTLRLRPKAKADT